MMLYSEISLQMACACFESNRFSKEAEVSGLLALMEILASRLAARTAPDGTMLTLLQQDRGRWDRLLIRRGLEALDRAERLGGGRQPYTLQAALAACHARAKSIEDTDWARIASLYDILRDVVPSPVVELNRAVAHSMAFGPEAGLALLDAISPTGVLRNYAPLPAARGDFLYRAGRLAEARPEFEHAAALTRNERERDFLLGRAAECGG